MNLFPNLPLVVAAAVIVVAAGIGVHRNRGTRARGTLVRRSVLAVMLVAIALRPMVGTTTQITYSSGVDVILMVDRTTSMAAEDHAAGQTRLEGAKEDLAKLVASVEGSRFAVIVFDNDGRVALPFTTDASAAMSLADAIGWRESAYGVGTDISVGIPTAQRLLERSRTQRPDVGRYLVYVGDGEQTTAAAPASFAPLAPLIDGGYVLGYGSDEGGPMKEYEGAEDHVTRDGEVVRSVIDEDNLRQIASELGVPYLHRAGPGQLALPVTGEVQVATERRDPRGSELYWIVALGALAVLAVDVWDGTGRIRRTQELLR